MVLHLACVGSLYVIPYQNVQLLKILLIHQGPAHTGTTHPLICPLSKHPSDTPDTYYVPLFQVLGIPQYTRQSNCIHSSEGEWGGE